MTEQTSYAYGYARMPRPLHEHTCYLCKQAFTSTKKRKLDFCKECTTSPLYEISKILLGQLRRARKADVPATLTLDEWLETLNFFGGMCAYCRVRPYKCMDHFIPIEIGGGTTRNNIIPACHGCNHRKGSYPPGMILSPEEFERVEIYLFGNTEVNA